MTASGPADRREDERARLPLEASTILERRDLASGNPGLERLLRPGIRVVDVGCGSGSISRDIARVVGPTGSVLGVDVDIALLTRAEWLWDGVSNLSFEVCDIRHQTPRGRFDVACAARVLQWISTPTRAVESMRRVLVRGGVIQLYDYDHTLAEWQPALPRSMERFYEAFLAWRADAGMDNRIAQHLHHLLRTAGLSAIETEAISQEWGRESVVEWAHATIWADVAASRGHQLVRDGYISERARKDAERDYRSWLDGTGERHSVFLAAAWGVHGRDPRHRSG